jgi:hypothetical protein
LGLEQWYISQILKGLTKEEKQTMVRTITDEFISSMSPQERKETVRIVLPDIVNRLMADMTFNDRKELVEMLMPLMVAQMGEVKAATREKKESKTNPEGPKERR